MGYDNLDDYVITGSQSCIDVSPFAEKYYCHKFMNSTTEELTLEKVDDLQDKVTKLDIMEVNSSTKEEVKKLYEEVLAFSGEEFYTILNTYVNLLLVHEINFDKSEIKEKISNYECTLGYCKNDGNYDFELSIYLNNILNLLEGDEHAQGFR